MTNGVGRSWLNLRVLIAITIYLFGTLCVIVPSVEAYVFLKWVLPIQQVIWTPSRSEQFDAATWQQAQVDPYGEDCARITMVNDLLERYQLLGMTKSEVEALLGKPDAEDYPLEGGYGYCLGLEQSDFIRIDPAYLVLRFDDSEKVVEIKKYGF